MVNSMMLGAIFAIGAGILLKSPSMMASVVAGIAFGLATWVGLLLVTANALQSSSLFADSIPVWAWVAGHGMFGAVIGLVWSRASNSRGGR